jgi:peptidoglycan-associated lipoprotein
MPIRRSILTVAMLGLLAACGQNAPYGNTPPPGFGGGVPTDAVDVSVFGAGVTDTVLFPVDTWDLTDAATATLTAQAAWFTRNPQATAVIEGHADERGTREYNIGLSARRANSVVEFLVLNGVAPSRLTTIPYGKDRPLEICSDEACYARNRRAVTVVAGSVDLGS